MESRGRRIRRTIVRASIFLLLGAIVDIAVAWGCARLSKFSESESLSEHDAFTLFLDRSILEPTRRVDGHTLNAPGLRMNEASVHGGVESRAIFAYLMIFDAGWPAVSLRAEWRGSATKADQLLSNITLQYGIETSGSARDGQFAFGKFVYPTRPIWPGFAVNTLFYAAILWLLLAFPGALRRWRRLKRGLCPACAYPVGTSDLCTECGKPVTPRSVEPAPS